MDRSLKNIFKGIFEYVILLGCAFSGPFESAACSPVFPGFMAEKKKGIDVVCGVFPAILVKNPASSGQTHGRQTIILSNDNIASLNPVDQCKINTVRAFVNNQGHNSILVKFMGGIAHNDARNLIFFAKVYDDFCDGTAVCINQYSQEKSPLRHIIP